MIITASVPAERKVAALRALSTLFKDVFAPRCARVLSAGSQETLSPLSYICYMFWDVTPLATWLKFDNEEQMSISFLASLSEEDFARMNLPEGAREVLDQQLAQNRAKVVPLDELNAKTIRQYQQMGTETRSFYEAIASVMESCLYLDNPACMESGLHGLGHLATFQADIAVPIIDKFLKNRKKPDTELLYYAQAARTGMIL